jgi:hypothetical protein
VSEFVNYFHFNPGFDGLGGFELFGNRFGFRDGGIGRFGKGRQEGPAAGAEGVAEIAGGTEEALEAGEVAGAEEFAIEQAEALGSGERRVRVGEIGDADGAVETVAKANGDDTG